MLIRNKNKTARVYLKDTNGLTMDLRLHDVSIDFPKITVGLSLYINGVNFHTTHVEHLPCGDKETNIKNIEKYYPRYNGLMDELHHQVEIAKDFTDGHEIIINNDFTISIKEDPNL